ncbi:MAG TPA: hypothetical protein VFZ97_19895 [Acidimicrobiales bacterium]
MRRSLVALAIVSAAVISPLLLQAAPASASTALVGTFDITAGSCNGGHVSGSYFRMILQGGNAGGPFLSNSDSTCSDQSYTPMAPGTDGGLATGRYQPQPSPAFDGSGNALAKRIITPARFYGVGYSASTQPTDPQTDKAVPAPQITVSGTALSGSVQAVSVSWNNQYFNQGSPKPDGTYPGDTTPVTGTYDPGSGSYTLQWTSQVVGGPFNGFSGLWHLTGRFVPAGSASSAISSSSSVTPAAPASHGLSPAAGAKPAGTAGSTPGAAASTATPPPNESSGASGASASSAQDAVGGGSNEVGAGGTALVTKVVAKSGLGIPAWAVALVIAAGVLGLGGFIGTDRRIRSMRSDS